MAKLKNNVETTSEFEIKLNSVSDLEVAYPNLSEYNVANSVSSSIDEDSIKEYTGSYEE